MQFLHLHLILLLRRCGKHRAYCLHKVVKHAFMLIIAAVTTLLGRLISRAFLLTLTRAEFPQGHTVHDLLCIGKLWTRLSDKVLDVG